MGGKHGLKAFIPVKGCLTMSNEELSARVPSPARVSEEPDRLAQPVNMEAAPRLPFAVIGIGASAGGLEACIEFFEAQSSGSGMAHVVILHLPPDRESLVAEILAKHAAMRVLQIEDGMPVEPDHVYVIRPGFTPTIKDGHLHLGESLEKPGNNRPVDDFFKSLAEEQRERAMCVIMSGMGSNGTAGAQAVKAVGGLVIAQDPDTAKFPSMPRSVIDASYADFILRPAEIPQALLNFASHAYATRRVSADELFAREKQHFGEILTIIRSRVRHDFSAYKKPTVLRRIQRRMGLHQVNRMAEYVTLLRQSPHEATALCDDLLIHVTGFFRDPEAWEALREQVIVPLVAGRESQSSIRCWVTACASGEEAYTLAMLLAEAAEAARKTFDIKVFATDTAERTLSHARSGTYPMGIESEVTPERLQRFFDKDELHYRVKSELREMVVFAPQNVIQDPPFSRLDICTCRNLLIYLEPTLQKRVLSLLHFGLREGGALMLGTSETVTGVDDLFEQLDKRGRIFRRIGSSRHGLLDFQFPTERNRSEPERFPIRPGTKVSVAQVTSKLLLDKFTPPAVTVNRQNEILYFHGDTSQYLTQPSGEPTRDLLDVSVRHCERPCERSCMTPRRTMSRLVPRTGTSAIRIVTSASK